MGKLIDSDVFEKCLADLMRRRNVKRHMETAFDAADFEDLLDEAASLTEQSQDVTPIHHAP